jgi:two-component system, cell cycle response regulator DivK
MTQHTILIVEDDPNSRKLLRDVLQAKGYETIEAGSGEDGVELAKTRLPALILMDIQLPRISGLDALRLIRTDARAKAIPVIAVTASVMTAQQQSVLDAGFDAFERKPVSVAGLLAKIERWIKTPR